MKLLNFNPDIPNVVAYRVEPDVVLSHIKLDEDNAHDEQATRWYLSSTFGEDDWVWIAETKGVMPYRKIRLPTLTIENFFEVNQNPIWKFEFKAELSDIVDNLFQLEEATKYRHVWYMSPEHNPMVDDVWAIDAMPIGPTSVPDNHRGYIEPYAPSWPMVSVDDKDYYWHFDDDVLPDSNWIDKFTPALGDEDRIHIFQRKNPMTGLVYDYKGCMLVPYGADFTTLTPQNTKRIPKAGCVDRKFAVIFLSYGEPFADENFEKLKEVAPNAYHLRDVKGIFNAHKKAASMVLSDMFYVVDADAILDKHFKFDYYPNQHDRDTVHVWRSRNPVNGLIYGYGGVKLFPTQALRDADDWHIDFTTSVTSKFKAVPKISNTTAFNTDSFNAWKSAFRECTKLASGAIRRGKADENKSRLEAWCTVGAERPFGRNAIAGAIAGKAYGEKYRGATESLDKINDFEWLREQFED